MTVLSRLQCDALDASLASLLLATGGANYSAVTQLTYRQVFGANGFAWNGSALWMYQKVRSARVGHPGTAPCLC